MEQCMENKFSIGDKVDVVITDDYRWGAGYEVGSVLEGEVVENLPENVDFLVKFGSSTIYFYKDTLKSNIVGAYIRARKEEERRVTSQRWTPGQRLSSAAEVMQALLDYQVVTDADGFSWEMRRGLVERAHQMQLSSKLFDVNNGPFSIYTPPKRKVKSERWFAVIMDTFYPDNTTWMGPYLDEDKARKHHGNALTYARAECIVEVELPGDSSAG